jgi:hypothetical protein
VPSESAEKILDSLKRAAALLDAADIPFAVGGGTACWVFGAPESDHDVDLLVREADVRRAQEVLVDSGMRPEDPPEDWLLKVYDGEVLIDLIFEPIGVPVTDELLERCPVRDVLAKRMKVMPLEDIFTTKLLAMNEHYLDYLGMLKVARAVREQVDWDAVRTRTAESPFARAFFTMVEGLGVVEPAHRQVA